MYASVRPFVAFPACVQPSGGMNAIAPSASVCVLWVEAGPVVGAPRACKTKQSKLHVASTQACMAISRRGRRSDRGIRRKSYGKRRNRPLDVVACELVESARKG